MSYDPKEYWDKRANSWKAQDFSTYQEWLEIADYLEPELVTIELGSGTGRWAPYFDTYAGFEIADELVKYAQKENPGKSFFQHDMRSFTPHAFKVDGKFREVEQYFSFTSFLHVPPKDITRTVFPDHARVVLIEPWGESKSEHCFQHDYEKLFGMKEVKRFGKLAIYVREKQ